jgi:hypothetical protein
MDGDATELIERQCPRLLAEGYDRTSDPSAEYNCVAWALGENTRWWEPVPGYYWPVDVPRDDTLENYILVFERAGYERCADPGHEAGYEKLAIYVDEAGDFAHAAKQRNEERWTSKMSWFEDIEHSSAESLLGGALNQIALVLRRRIAG